MAMVATAFHHSSETSCDFSGVDVESAISQMLAKFPKEHMTVPILPRPNLPGMKLFDLAMSGIRHLRRYGAVIPFCVNRTRMIQVDLVNEGDIYFSIPWKICTGKRGSFRLRPMLTRFTTVFRLEATEFGEEIRLAYEGPTLPVNTEELRFSVEGLGFTVRLFSEYLSLAFPAVFRSLWNIQFAYYFDLAVTHALG
ncbi:hypothetical protein V5799_005712 [Amblyomma americanum]|uniref:Uncharacterized protein n=1 Tax=Amblyomma americanum TaxID=6943 RepID=A0AAQ4DYG7_AMBAM